MTAALAVLAAGSLAHAQTRDCVGQGPRGDVFLTCFDPGNRLYASVATNGYGGGLDVRHEVDTDDPSVTWRLEHAFASIVSTGMHANAGGVLSGSLYSGRFMRHSSDGHILIPFGPPRKVYVPFDVGAETEVGHLVRRFSEDRYQVGAIRSAVLIELSRSSTFRQRLAIGPVLRWDIAVRDDISGVDEHRVTPFSAGLLDAYVESEDGLTRAHLRLEAGRSWSNDSGWGSSLDAEFRLERILLALNDRPISIFAMAGYARGRAVVTTPDARVDDDEHWTTAVGARMALSRAISPVKRGQR